MKAFFYNLLLAILIFNISNASARKLHSTFEEWAVFTDDRDGQKICYIIAIPQKEQGDYKRRGAPYAIVTVAKDKADEFSASSGYPYKNNSKPTVTFDNKKKFELLVDNEILWAQDANQDKEIILHMKKGSKMEVYGNSRINSYSKDTYSLMGFTKAYSRMKRLCAVDDKKAEKKSATVTQEKPVTVKKAVAKTEQPQEQSEEIVNEEKINEENINNENISEEEKSEDENELINEEDVTEIDSYDDSFESENNSQLQSPY